MPWKIKSKIGERMRFVKLALRAQTSRSQLCRLFGVSRAVGYKWLRRFEQGGRRALRDGSRRPRISPRKTPSKWLKRIRDLRRRRRHWGAKKIRVLLRQSYGAQRVPAVSTIAKWLARWGLTRCGRRRSRPGPPVIRAALTQPHQPNEVWTVDFKGWFRTQVGERIEPLTVRDLFSRYVLTVQLLPDQSWWRVRAVFTRLFRKRGLPHIIRVDNGGPFASVGPAGLSRLSAWWSSLGIVVEFIAPAHPEQNGAHEQFHRVLKAEVTRPASTNLRAQQRRIDRWVQQYNHQRPHEALGQRPPARYYRASARRYPQRQGPPCYPANWSVRRVRSNGQIKWQGRLRFIGEAFVGYRVGLKVLDPSQAEVYFGSLLLGVLRASDAGGLRPSAYVPLRPTIR